MNIIIWGGCTESKIKKLRISINKVLRNILSIKNNHDNIPIVNNDYLYRTLKVLKFDDIYLCNMLMFIHIILYGSNFSLFDEYIGRHMRHHGYQIRGNRLNIPTVRLEVEKQGT